MGRLCRTSKSGHGRSVATTRRVRLHDQRHMNMNIEETRKISLMKLATNGILGRILSSRKGLGSSFVVVVEGKAVGPSAAVMRGRLSLRRMQPYNTQIYRHPPLNSTLLQVVPFLQTTMSTTAQEPTTASTETTEPTKQEENVPQLGALEEDDEFEEFAAQGQSR